VVIAESSRAIVTGAVAAALVLGWLSLPVLLAAAALLGIGQAACSAPRYLLLRSAVPPAQPTAALTQDEVRMNGAALVGPPLGGVLYSIRALAHAVPFVCTAVSLALSVLTALPIRVRPDAAGAPGGDPPPAGEPGPGAASEPGATGMLAGVTALWANPVLRGATVLIMIVSTLAAGLDLIVIVILRDQAVSSAMIGLALGGGAVGGLVGAPLVPVLHRLPPGLLLLTICLLLAPVFALLAVLAGPWWAAGVLFVSMLGVPSIRVLLDVLVFRQAPASQRGRTVSAVLTLIGLGAPAGLAAAGLMLQYLPAPVAILILAAVLAVGVLCCATIRPLRQARWPA
jgi:predicted MFS family arabinose efflux permease